MAEKGVMVSAQVVVVQTCQLCNSAEDVKWYCETCCEIMCNKCKEIHLKSKKSRNDIVIYLSEARKEGKIKKAILPVLCTEHKTKECELYCEACSQIICSLCLASKHQKHALTTIEEFIATKEAELKVKEEELNDKLTMYEKAISIEGNAHVTYQSHIEKLTSDLEDQYNTIISVYAKCRDQHLRTLKTLGNEEHTRYSEACSSLQLPLDKVKTMIETVQDTKESGDAVRLKDLSQEIKKNVESLEVPTSPAMDFVSFYRGKLTEAEAMHHFGLMNPKLPMRQSVKGGATGNSRGNEAESCFQADQSYQEDTLHDKGLSFTKKCLAVVEKRGLSDQGLYSVRGVSSKADRLIKLGLDPATKEVINFDDPVAYEIKTITTAVKNYLRTLPEPLLTFKLQSDLITAAKQEDEVASVRDIHKLVHQLPGCNFEMLDLIINHLTKVAGQSQKNLMTKSNLSLCFGATLMRPASFTDIYFYNAVVEILISNYSKIFKSKPGPTLPNTPAKPALNVRTLYHCEGGDDTELSFAPNQIIKNVRPSREPGWFEGELDGKIGLIPANYVEYID